jgi:hypothetical protein
MTGRHHRWHQHWTVSLAAQESRHDSGLVYDWAEGADAGPPPLATIPCCDLAGGWWVGRLRGGEAGMRAWLATQPALRDPASQRRRLLRLAREAGEAYAHALRHALRVEVRP